MVDGSKAANTYKRKNSGYHWESGSTSIVLHLLAGQEVAVKTSYTGAIHGHLNEMKTSFGVTLLYPD